MKIRDRSMEDEAELDGNYCWYPKRKIKKVLYEPRNLIPKMKPKKKIRKY